MPNFEREKEILKILEKKYTVSVKELADTLKIRSSLSARTGK